VYNQDALFEREATGLRCMLHAYHQIGMFSDKEGVVRDRERCSSCCKSSEDREGRR